MVAPDDEPGGAGRRPCVHRRVAEEPRAERQADAAQDGGERHVAEGRRDDDPHARREQDGPGRQREESAQRGGHALASLEAEEYRPAVAHDGEQRPGGAPDGLGPQHLRRPDGEIALRDVTEQGQHCGDGAESPEHIGGTDVAAALAPDVEASRSARDQETDRDRADEVDPDEAQRPHGQRSWSLMIARGPALR